MPDYDNSGALFINDKKTKDSQPDFTGNITINGEKKRLAAWKKESNGKKFIAIRVSEIEQQQQKPKDDFNW